VREDAAGEGPAEAAGHEVFAVWADQKAPVLCENRLE